MDPSVPNHCQSSAGCFPAGMCALHLQPSCRLAGTGVLIVNESIEPSRDKKKVEGGSKNGRGEKGCSLFMKRVSKWSRGQHPWVTAVLSPVEDQVSAHTGTQPSV